MEKEYTYILIPNIGLTKKGDIRLLIFNYIYINKYSLLDAWDLFTR